MKFLKKLLRNESTDIDWEEVKHSDLVYPKHSFTMLKLTMTNGDFGTGWVDVAYKKYEFKKKCPYHIKINIDLTGELIKNDPDLDMGTIEDFFSDQLKRICTYHLVSRIASNKGMEMDGYLEMVEPVDQYLNEVSLGENRLVTFAYEIDFDPKWRQVNRLLNI